MWISAIHPHTWDDSHRLPPDLRLIALFKHRLRCGEILDNLPIKLKLIFSLFASLPYIGLSKNDPLYMGVAIFKLSDQLSEKEGYCPQGRRVFHSFRGLIHSLGFCGKLLSKQLPPNVAC